VIASGGFENRPGVQGPEYKAAVEQGNKRQGFVRCALASQRPSLKVRTLGVRPRGALAFVKAPDLGTVSAHFHVAPAAAVVAAGIQEKPLAVFRLAGADTVEVGRSQQIKSGAKNRPQNAVAGSFIFVVGNPLPFEAGLSATKVKVFGHPAPFAANFIQMVSRGILLLHDCGKNAVQCFADLTGTLHDFLCRR